MDLEIIYQDDTALAEHEALFKEYRGDIIVKTRGKKYKVYVTTMLRLQQDYDTEVAYSGFYQSEPNTIIVKDTTKQEIEATILYLYQRRYFEQLDAMGFHLEDGETMQT